MHGGMLNTLVPEGRVVLLEKKRLLTGIEAMSIQGFPLHPLRQYAEKNGRPAAVDKQFFDLAGNAFSAPAVGAVMLAALTLLTGNHLLIFAKGSAVECDTKPDDEDSANDDVMQHFRSL